MHSVCIQLPNLQLMSTGTFLCNALVRREQKFGPPDFPGFITTRTPQTCVWVYGGVPATLNFMYFDIPESEGCSEGNVKLYDNYYRNNRTLVATLCGALGTESRSVNISTTYFSIELNLGPNHQSYRGIHAVVEN